MSDERWIIIPRWDEFQHRDMARSSQPPWIKVYTRLLHDEDYLKLTGDQRAILHGLWLEYASSRRRLRLDTRSLSSRLRLRVTTAQLESLNHAGFIEFAASRPASNLASLEVEVEGEKSSSKTSSNSKAGSLPLLETSNARPSTNGQSLPLSQSLDEIVKPIDTDRRFDPVCHLLDLLPDADAGTETILRNFRLPEYAYQQAIEEVRPPRRGSVKLAVTILKRVKSEIEAQRVPTPPSPDADIEF